MTMMESMAAVFYRLAHLSESASARKQPRFAAPSRSLVTFLSRCHGQWLGAPVHLRGHPAALSGPPEAMHSTSPGAPGDACAQTGETSSGSFATAARPCVLRRTIALARLRQAARWRLGRFNASRGTSRKDENDGQPKHFRRAFIAKVVDQSGLFDESGSRGVVTTHAIRIIERRCALGNRDDDRARVAVPTTISTRRQRLV